MTSAKGRPFDWIDLLLPNGGVLVNLIAHFDESGTHKDSDILCVAGYLMEAENARLFASEWRQALAEVRVEYFHMKDLGPGNGPFKRLDRSERDKLGRKLIPILKNRMSQGLTTILFKRDYVTMPRQHRSVGSPYTFCVRMCLKGVQKWIDESGFDGEIAYVFEAGADHQGEANRIMDEVFRNESARNAFRYDGHAFRDKKREPGLQAADLLAWHSIKDINMARQNRAKRADFAALLDGTVHKAIMINTANIDYWLFHLCASGELDRPLTSLG